MAYYLNEERKFRFGSTDHKSFKVIRRIPLPWLVDLREWTDPYQAINPARRVEGDPITAYREYYIHDKDHLFGYTKREIPEWHPRVT